MGSITSTKNINFISILMVVGFGAGGNFFYKNIRSSKHSNGLVVGEWGRRLLQNSTYEFYWFRSGDCVGANTSKKTYDIRIILPVEGSVSNLFKGGPF